MVPIFLHAGTAGPGVVPDLFSQFFPDVHVVRSFQGEKPQQKAEKWKALVVLGGPESVMNLDKHPYLKDELVFVRQALELKIPVLGICLGGQMIAHAKGFKVGGSQVREYGIISHNLNESSDHYLLRGLPNPFPTMHWHEDAFEANVVPLMSTPGCRYQLVDWGNHVVSTQFHPELDEKDYVDWTNTMKDRFIVSTEVTVNVPEFNYFSEYRRLGDRFLLNYLQAIG